MEPFKKALPVAGLIIKYLEKDLDESGKIQLEKWLHADAQNSVLFEQLINEKSLQQELREMANTNTEAAWENVKGKILETEKIIPIHKSYKKWWMAAAASILLICAVGYFLMVNHKGHTILAKMPSSLINDIAPGGNKATLTLADGTKIILDSTNNGAITKQGNVTIIKLNDGQLAYEAAAQNAQLSIVTYNTITTPRGGQYQIVLADGSRVWLNAASSITYPTAFTGKERKVVMTGEAYFEVAHNEKMPFIVSKGDVDIKVLGTHFNVNAYEDEGEMKVTLLEGSVNVVSGDGQSIIIKPGQQAVITDGIVELRNNVTVEHETAWKNGLFDFQNDGLPFILRQISRWYNVDIIYPTANHAVHYSGSIRKSSEINEVLKMLEIAGDVSFSIVGKKVVVNEKK